MFIKTVGKIGDPKEDKNDFENAKSRFRRIGMF